MTSSPNTSCSDPGAAELPPPLLLAGCGCASVANPTSTANSVSACTLPSGTPPAPAAPAGPGQVVLHIPAMDCAVEEGEIRELLAKLPWVRPVRFDLARRTLALDVAPAQVPEVLALLNKAGFKATPLDPMPTAAAGAAPIQSPVTGWPRELVRYGLALALAVAAELLALLAPASAWVTGAGLLLAAAAIALAGLSTYVKGLAALRQGRLNINALMTVAVSGAFVIGQWPEAAMVMALYALAEWLEARAVVRARNAIQSLLALTPEAAELRQGDGTWQTVPAAAVPLQAVIRVKPGARLPLDGVVLAGRSAVNQAAVTGESLPVDKDAGDPVFAGTINGAGLLEVRVTALASNTLMARIMAAVEQAQSSRAPTQQWVDQFARIYTPAVFAMAVAVALGLPWVMEVTWLQALYKALVLLVIACPCALVISTPVTVVSGLAAAARRGILIKGGAFLESAHRLKVIALDKTGTLTTGQPTLVATELLAPQADRAQVLAWAAGLAGHSDHPVAQALARGLAPDAGPLALSELTDLPGRGVQAVVDGRALVLGNARLMEERGLGSPALQAQVSTHTAQGRTVTLLASPDQVLALFAVADTIKATSREALAELRELGVHTVMLSGDNQATAQTMATQAGMADARGDLLPEDKLRAIEALQTRHGLSAMVGDGINDAPALARADIGIAMGGAGTDTAMEAADVVIMNDDLRRIPETLRLSRHTQRVLRQNMALALGIKAVFLLLAVFDSATMWMAVFADMGASLLVVANGLRLLKWTGR